MCLAQIFPLLLRGLNYAQLTVHRSIGRCHKTSSTMEHVEITIDTERPVIYRKDFAEPQR